MSDYTRAALFLGCLIVFGCGSSETGTPSQDMGLDGADLSDEGTADLEVDGPNCVFVECEALSWSVDEVQFYLANVDATGVLTLNGEHRFDAGTVTQTTRFVKDLPSAPDQQDVRVMSLADFEPGQIMVTQLTYSSECQPEEEWSVVGWFTIGDTGPVTALCR